MGFLSLILHLTDVQYIFDVKSIFGVGNIWDVENTFHGDSLFPKFHTLPPSLLKLHMRLHSQFRSIENPKFVVFMQLRNILGSHVHLTFNIIILLILSPPHLIHTTGFKPYPRWLLHDDVPLELLLSD